MNIFQSPKFKIRMISLERQNHRFYPVHFLVAWRLVLSVLHIKSGCDSEPCPCNPAIGRVFLSGCDFKPCPNTSVPSLSTVRLRYGSVKDYGMLIPPEATCCRLTRLGTRWGDENHPISGDFFLPGFVPPRGTPRGLVRDRRVGGSMPGCFRQSDLSLTG